MLIGLYFLDKTLLIDWSIEFFKALTDDESIKCRQDINWKKLSRDLDLPIARLENVFTNNVRDLMANSYGRFQFAIR
jgi:hypothetical protein